jgi:hypothetical protein
MKKRDKNSHASVPLADQKKNSKLSPATKPFPVEADQ